MARNTPAPIQQFRGTATQLDDYTGPVGELTVDTTNKIARVQDGTTKGGNPLVNTTTAQSISGVKTFSSSPIVPTQSAKDSSTKAASTAYVDNAVENIDPTTLPKTTKSNLGVAQVGSGLHVKDGIVGLGETEKPVVTSPSAGANVPLSGFTVTGSAFNTLYISDTQKSARWVVYQNGAIVADVTSTTDLTSHTFTSSELSGLTAGAASVQVQYTGNIAGESEFSDAVNITIQSASVNQPTITAPTNNSDVYPSASILVSTSAFSVSGGTDTHLNSDYKITSDAAGNTVVAQALASSDKTSHTFTSADLTGMTLNQDFYIFARHRGATLGESPWSSSVKVTAKSGQVTPTNRTVYRHPSNKGSVIVYNEFGVTKNLLVYDAAYRTRANKKWGQSGVDVPGINNWPHYYAPTCTGNVIDSSTGYTDLRSIADLTPYKDKLTDAWFQAALTATLASVIQSAKAATDILMNYSDTEAAHFCRDQNSVIPGIEAQLPNIYQALVMFAEGDVIDSLDPTLAANPTMALGKYTNSNRWFSGIYAWSSTEHSSTTACAMLRNGLTNGNTKTNTYSVAPVAEI